MEKNVLIGVGVLALIAVIISNPALLQSGQPSGIVLKVVGNDSQPVEGAICYLNPSGLTSCQNTDRNSNRCQWKAISNKDGICNFGIGFNSSIDWPLGVKCPAEYDGRSVYKSVWLIPGRTNTFPMSCVPVTEGQGTVDLTPGVDSPMTPDEKGSTLCLYNIYPDEFCSDFSSTSRKRFYSYYGMEGDMKVCAREPEWVMGECFPPAVNTGELCVQNPTYETPVVCKSGYVLDGGYCCIAPVDPKTEYSDCSSFPGSRREARDGIPVCVKDLNLVDGESGTPLARISSR